MEEDLSSNSKRTCKTLVSCAYTNLFYRLIRMPLEVDTAIQRTLKSER
jgi:hypothetical protein